LHSTDVKPFDTSNIVIDRESKLVALLHSTNYIGGFVAGDGSFFYSLRMKPSSNSKCAQATNYDATFSIAQNNRDIRLLNRIAITLGLACAGNIK
jgi:hypothetical protein